MDYKVTEQLLHLIADMSRDENKNEVQNIGQAIVAPIWWRVAAMYWQSITLGHNTQHTCTGANQLEDTFLTFMSDAWKALKLEARKTYIAKYHRDI